jgi:exocyst complex component 2
MAVVAELDKTLFDGYVKPKSDMVTTVTRNGIDDPEMDWYQTPQPTGAYPLSLWGSWNSFVCRNPAVHV